MSYRAVKLVTMDAIWNLSHQINIILGTSWFALIMCPYTIYIAIKIREYKGRTKLYDLDLTGHNEDLFPDLFCSSFPPPSNSSHHANGI